jgi:hypothetical protein
VSQIAYITRAGSGRLLPYDSRAHFPPKNQGPALANLLSLAVQHCSTVMVQSQGEHRRSVALPLSTTRWPRVDLHHFSEKSLVALKQVRHIKVEDFKKRTNYYETMNFSSSMRIAPQFQESLLLGPSTTLRLDINLNSFQPHHNGRHPRSPKTHL